MAAAWTIDAGLLALRLGVGYVMLYAAWKNTENAAAWNWTINETSILFPSRPNQQQLAKVCAVIGVVMMYFGGASVLAGAEPRLGGLAIAVFCLLGMVIHRIRRDEAKKAGESGDAMGWSAYSAHIAAGLKNWALVGAGVALMLMGAGRFGLRLDYCGQLLGLLGGQTS